MLANNLGEQIIVDILKTFMGLSAENVWIRNQNKVVPNDNGLYIIVGAINSEILSVSNKPETVTITPPSPDPPYQGLKESITVNSVDSIQIDVLSRDPAAVQRRAEVLAALGSIYSIQQQEENACKIAKISAGFVNSSDAEGGSNINRFSLTVRIFVWYKYEKVLGVPYDFYNSFDTRVDDEKTIGEENGLIEFTIAE